jgi:cytochrome c-type biogenesis protein CcsB
MLKKIASVLFSTRMMAILFIVYAVAMAAGTFIESKYNTDTARILVYNSWWFEAIHVFFLINFIGNIKRYQLLKKEKWATLLLHLSFIFILIGATITRYISFEGVMPIRENATENIFYSDKSFLTVLVDGEHDGKMARLTFEKPVLFSQAIQNSFSLNKQFDKFDFSITKKEFIMGAKQIIKADKNGSIYLKLVESSDGKRHEHLLKSGEVQNIHNLLFSLNKFTQGAVNINTLGEVYTVNMPFDGQFMRMADKMQGKVVKNATQPLMMRSLYNVGDAQFVFPEPAKKGIIAFESSNDYKAKNQDDAVVLNISTQNQEKEVTLVGSKGKAGEPVTVKIGALEFTLFYGSKAYSLPFSVRLNNFEAQKYPGTEKSYSSYESQVTVIDNPNFDARIYMNHVLDHKGYRFFQSSFDPDEKGTVLSVSHDFWGTWITYIGYFLLFFAMMAILFTKHSRFADLKRKLEIVKTKKTKLITVLFLVFSCSGFSQSHNEKMPTTKEIDSLLEKYKVNEIHAAQFGRLIIQDLGGRMKPINTFSSELLRKVSHSDKYKTLNADQVFLSITQFPEVWYEVPLIYIRPEDSNLRNIIGIDLNQKFAKFSDFFDAKGNYKLSKNLEAAARLANPNALEKSIVETDKKVNLMSSALFGSILKIFPIPSDKNNKWVSYPELNEANIHGRDSIFVKNFLPVYLQSLNMQTNGNSYKSADFYLNGIKKYQKIYGSKVIPTERKITLEILYNKYDILQKLFFCYATMAMIMMFFVILKIFKETKTINYLINGSHIIIAILFVLQTLTLIARWYISGHAPWSNAYEAIVYVSWSAMFFGLAFDLKFKITRTLPTSYNLTNILIGLFYLKPESQSKLTVAACAFVASMILMAAYANWVDPEIANLQPVLNSYWLMIHVAVIVASYGPFALGMILGFVSLILMICTTKSNKQKMDLNIQEITYINEMALTVGLVMLTIGNFLGGQWANESWGRYWGWDPKETWALISIMVYAFVIHARFVPALRGKWIFNLMSMYAFISILFTYYGVNFHLTGLHSYASGEAKSLSWIWYSFGTISLLGIISYFPYQKYYKK